MKISRLSDGRKFNLKDKYKVAMNSYRANGGGNHLTDGAGIPAKELTKRVLTATDKDLRYYLIEEIKKGGDLVPKVDGNWKFIPEKLVTPAVAIDRQILFSPQLDQPEVGLYYTSPYQAERLRNTRGGSSLATVSLSISQ